MAVIRQFNALSQMRIDVPHIRSLDSAVAADFDILAGRVAAGERAVVVRGLTLANLASGAAATELQLVVADAIVYNVNASESGTFLWVPSDRSPEVLNSATNSRVVGGFVPNQTNYVGLDLVRSADTSTTDLVQFLDLLTRLETGKEIPLARTLDYKIVISTVPFSSDSTIIPVLKVTTNASNQVSSADDARNLLFRLGTGGDAPDSTSSYSWPQGRSESTTLSTALFRGGDKAISSQKEWQDAVMSRLWELGGGEHWYSATADRNVNLVWTGSPFSNGENYEWDGTNLHWTGLRFLFDNSTVYYRDVQNQTVDSAGLTDLADGDCIYVDLGRDTNATSLVALKAPLISVGGGTPGRWILAWRQGTEIYTRGWRYPVGTTFIPATNTSMGMVKLNQPNVTPLIPKVFGLNSYSGLTVGINFGANNGYVISGNNPAINVEGGGTGNGINALGGSGGGWGGLFTGSAVAGAHGLVAIGEGDAYVAPGGLGNGIYAQGGSTSDGAGVWATGGGNTGVGLIAEGASAGAGGWGASIAAVTGNNRGLRAQGSGTEEGIKGVGGATGHGILGHAALEVGLGTVSYSLSKVGVIGKGSAAGEGVVGIGGNTGGTGVGGYASNGTTGVGGWFVGGDAGGRGLNATAGSYLEIGALLSGASPGGGTGLAGSDGGHGAGAAGASGQSGLLAPGAGGIGGIGLFGTGGAGATGGLSLTGIGGDGSNGGVGTKGLGATGGAGLASAPVVGDSPGGAGGAGGDGIFGIGSTGGAGGAAGGNFGFAVGGAGGRGGAGGTFTGGNGSAGGAGFGGSPAGNGGKGGDGIYAVGGTGNGIAAIGGHGVVGTAGNGTAGPGYGLYGINPIAAGTAIYGIYNVAGGAGFGIHGEVGATNNNGNSAGVKGTNLSGTGWGGYFTASGNGTGLQSEVSNAGWSAIFIQNGAGDSALMGGTNGGSVYFSGSSVPAARRKQTGRNVIQAHGVIHSGSGSGVGAGTIDPGSWNVSSVDISTPTFDTITVNFTVPLGNATYTLVVTPTGNGGANVPLISAKTTGGFSVKMVRTSTEATRINVDATDYSFSFIATGGE